MKLCQKRGSFGGEIVQILLWIIKKGGQWVRVSWKKGGQCGHISLSISVYSNSSFLKVMTFQQHFKRYQNFSCFVFLFAAFNLDYFTEVLDLNFLLQHLEDDPFLKKFKKLNEALIGVIQDYSLVSFATLNIQVRDSRAWPRRLKGGMTTVQAIAVVAILTVTLYLLGKLL